MRGTRQKRLFGVKGVSGKGVRAKRRHEDWKARGDGAMEMCKVGHVIVFQGNENYVKTRSRANR